MKGIILFGHGARNPGWAAPFHRIRDSRLARQPEALVEMGFLELMRPTLDEGTHSRAAACVLKSNRCPDQSIVVSSAARWRRAGFLAGP